MSTSCRNLEAERGREAASGTWCIWIIGLDPLMNYRETTLELATRPRLGLGVGLG